MTEEQKQNLKELQANLYKTPPGSQKYFDTLLEIRIILETEEKYQAFILTHSTGSFVYPSSSHTDLFKGGVSRIYGESSMFSPDQTIFNSFNGFRFVERFRAEHNVKYKQIVVTAIITDHTKSAFILLKTKKDATRIDDKFTMIQGHVDYDPSSIIESEKDFIRESILRELKEELSVVKGAHVNFNAILPEEPNILVNLRTSTTELEHTGIVYEILVEDIFTLFNQLKSGEEHIHDVALLTYHNGVGTYRIRQDGDVIKDTIKSTMIDNWFGGILELYSQESGVRYDGINKRHIKPSML